MAGPLAGLRIVELAGIGPGPFACMMLADHGAEVIQVRRPGTASPHSATDGADPLSRSRLVLRADLKNDAARAVVADLIAGADGVVEGYRPGVAERLGLGPEAMIARNPRLVYGRMTGWGQSGPLAQQAGHDINYIALSGALHAIGRRDANPVPPINLVGDFGGGAMMLAFGMVSALLHAQRSGEGQVIDCAMTDGAALLMAMMYGQLGEGRWRDARASNPLDGGAHYYDTYRTADGGHIAIGSIEPQFYAGLRQGLGVADDAAFDAQHDPAGWDDLRDRMAAIIATRTRDEWCAILEPLDICFAPVLSMAEAPSHPHNAARGTFIEVGGQMQPAPAPRYSVTRTDPPRPSRLASDADAVLAALGYAPDRVTALRDTGAIG